MAFYRSLRSLRRGHRLTLADIEADGRIPGRLWSWIEKNGDAILSVDEMRNIIIDILASKGRGLQTDIEEAIGDVENESEIEGEDAAPG